MEHRGGFRGRGSFGMNGRGRGRGIYPGRPGNFGGPMNGGMMRGRGRGGPPRGPPRMGMNPGMNRGSGRGRFPGPGRFPSESNGYFQNQSQNETTAPAPVQQPEAVTTEKTIPAVTPSSNNVQVVTSGQTQPASTQQQSQTTPSQSNPPMNNSRGSYTPRGRGTFSSRGGSFVPRGRGGYQGQNGPPRPFDTRQPSNLTPASTNNSGFNPIKRGGFQGPPGAKRGRYDQGPSGYAGNRSMPHQNQISSMPPQQHHQNSYNNVPPHSGAYQDHSSQYVDQYQHSGYNSNMPQQSGGYASNGYGQSYGNNAAPVSYAPQTDYDHTASSGYQDYNTSSYPAHDSRFTGYSQQDYRQPYGQSTDYGQVAQDSSSYSAGSYGNYDSYSQGYNGQSGYY